MRTAEESAAKPSEISNLKSQIRDLQAKVQQLTVKEQVPHHLNRETVQTPVPWTDLEVRALREQVTSLQNQLRKEDSNTKRVLSQFPKAERKGWPGQLSIIIGTNAQTFSHGPQSQKVKGDNKLAQTM